MENNTHAEKNAGQVGESNIILGTSSDDIVQGLHTGAFLDFNGENKTFTPDDSSIIVNEQEQNEIVNPVEEEFSEQPSTEAPAADTLKEKKDLRKEEIDGETADDELDTEDETDRVES